MALLWLMLWLAKGQKVTNETTLKSAPESAVTWAVFLVGELRTFTRETVYESLRVNVVEELEFVDLYLVVDPRSAENVGLATHDRFRVALKGMNLLGYQRVESARNIRRDKLVKCFDMMVNVEKQQGRRYSYILAARPDLKWLSPLEPLVRHHRKMIHLYDMAAVCPRSIVTKVQPCDSPNKPSSEGRLFHIHMERLDPALNSREFWLMAPLNELRSLIEVKKPTDDPRRFAQCTIRVVAHTCQRYGHYVDDLRRKLSRSDRLAIDRFRSEATISYKASLHAVLTLFTASSSDNAVDLSTVAKITELLEHNVTSFVGRSHAAAQNVETNTARWMSPVLEAICAPAEQCDRPPTDLSSAYGITLCLGATTNRRDKFFYYANPALAPHFHPEMRACLDHDGLLPGTHAIPTITNIN